MSKYTVVIRNPATEEYDGGNTLAEARKEAAFFVEHTKGRVTICTVDADSRLVLKEVVRP